MEDVLVPVMVVGMLFIGLPWLVMHYVTRWKTAATLTTDDEQMLGDMHELARRLEDRLETVERLVSVDNPDWHPRRLDHESEEYLSDNNIRKLERNR
jgi:phage shock protein B